ncbi:pitrilysin family protein [Tessaracoccus terricola]
MNRPTVHLAKRWSFPTPQLQSLPNGITAQVYDLPGQHVAALELVLPTPLAAEPRGLEGLATVALTAIDEGTIAHPEGRISELLELQGAAIHGVTLQSSTRLGTDAPAHRLAEVTPLFAEVLASPTYTAADVAHHVGLQVATHDSLEASPGAVAKRAFRAAFFGADAREGRPSAGTPETLTAISRDDVVAWHGRHWLPAGATLILAGDLSAVDVDEVLAPIGAWHAPGTPAPRSVAPALAPSVVVVDMPDAVQATVQLGCLTPGRRHPQWAALKLAGHAVTGAFASRLNLELRERLGYTYGVQGGFGARRTDGQFNVGTSFRTEVAADAVAKMLQGLELAEPFSDEEVADARAFLLGVAPLANETASDIARQAAALAAADEDPAFVNEHFDRLEDPSPADVTAAFREHVRPDRVTIAVSGNAAQLEPALRAAGLDPVVLDSAG